MIRKAMLVGLLAQTAFAGSVVIQEDVWFADNGQEHGLVAGPGGSWEFASNLWVEASALLGKYQNEGDIESHNLYEITAGKSFRFASAGLGFSYWNIDTELQPGWFWSPETPNEEEERNADIYGPLIGVSSDGRFGNGPFGWSAAASWMFWDFGPLADIGYDGTHVQLKGDLVFQAGGFAFSAGYRLDHFFDMPDRVSNDESFDRSDIGGVVLSAGVRF
jgi:hypothetical protein